MAGIQSDTSSSPNEKKYMSDVSLSKYDAMIKDRMASDDATVLSNAKKYTDDELTNFATEIDEAVDLLATAIESKADTVHTHTISQVDGLQAELNAKEAKGSSDTALASAKLYTDSEVDATLASAKSYTDTEVASALSEAKSYTNTELAELINGAPTTLDTLGEIATAMAENEDVVEALNTAIGSKANATHTHAVSDVTNLQSALDGKASSSHSHAISDVTNLQTQLDSKASSDHTHTDVTTAKSGYMSATDKTKLDNIEPNATNNKITIVRW